MLYISIVISNNDIVNVCMEILRIKTTKIFVAFWKRDLFKKNVTDLYQRTKAWRARGTYYKFLEELCQELGLK